MRALLLVSCSLLPWTASAQSRDASSSPKFAFTHVTVIDMTGAAPKPDMTVVITGNRIAAIGPSRLLQVPRGAPIRDATGKFLIPGFWDMHVHATWPETFPTFGPLVLVNGVTGIRDMWGRLDLVAGARIRLAQHRPTEPRIVVAGAMLDGDPPFLQGSVVVSSPEQGRRAVDSLEALGVDFIKVNSSLKPDVFAAVMAEAKRLRIPVAGHATITIGAYAVSRSGQRSIEHLGDILLSCSTDEATLRAVMVAAVLPSPHDSLLPYWDHKQARQLLATYSPEKRTTLADRFRRDSTWQVPTLTVNRTVAFLGDSADPRLQYLPPRARDNWLRTQPYFESTTPEEHEDSRRMFAKKLELVGLMHRSGVPRLAGTDVLNPFVFPGFAIHEELALLVEAGLTPMEALQTATRNPAIFLHTSDSLGTIARGKDRGPRAARRGPHRGHQEHGQDQRRGLRRTADRPCRQATDAGPGTTACWAPDSKVTQCRSNLTSLN